ncbi:hypothetical protein AJ80_07419 [Polytolypa hystricis UAMH7299]|uniref:Trichothecene 3-O-acetyltransferase n=1 Tax=Polytolypa hystricis (strain UAMH7299) TaxID=1447883 RepID=A0A2B7XP62_POLH7|nr:hypothetical protein AJ80_07419 [Polytolypa hystricis UAMH7299]
MAKREEFHLHASDYQNDPDEERFKISTIDYLTARTYNNYALFFKLDEADKSNVAAVLKEGLERTVSQCRQLVGMVEKDGDGHHSIVKKRESTIKFVVRWLDTPEDNFPSFSDLEKSGFTSPSLGDIAVFSIEGMTYGEKPECSLNANPVMAAFQANFIPGGLIFSMHHHHVANDIMGWASEVHQLAENCYSIVNHTVPPSWDPACLDHTRFLPKDIPEEDKIDGPSPPERHPDHRPSSFVLFHLPKSKAAELKKIATPTDGAWISTYDALSSFIWRILTKHRAPMYKPNMSSSILWGEAVNMRHRLHPRPPERIQGNVLFSALSTTTPVQQPSIAEVISEAPLSRLASYIRSLTNSATEGSLNKVLDMVAPVRDKTSLLLRANSFPPMSIIMTDWRDSRICEADFGFGRPVAFRHPTSVLAEGIVVIYPPRPTGDPDEGCEILIALENELIEKVKEDEETRKYFEFRGVETAFLSS